MSCECRKSCNSAGDANIKEKIEEAEADLINLAQNILRTASDPITAVIQFLQERPENAILRGTVIHNVLAGAFGEYENIPGLVKVLTGHVREIIRHANVINIINEHSTVEKWGSHIIKQTDKIKFEIAKERGIIVLQNIGGIFAIEHGISVPIEKITIKPPKLIVTLNVGLFRPNLTVDI